MNMLMFGLLVSLIGFFYSCWFFSKEDNKWIFVSIIIHLFFINLTIFKLGWLK